MQNCNCRLTIKFCVFFVIVTDLVLLADDLIGSVLPADAFDAV